MQFASGLKALYGKGFRGLIGGAMLNEPTSLASVVYRIGDTLKADYGIDPAPHYEAVGISSGERVEQGTRFPNSVVIGLWNRAEEITGDPAFGIKVGLQSEPSMYFVIGHMWLASSNLVDAIRMLIRYEEIIDSGITDIRFEKSDGIYVLSESYPHPGDYHGKISVDAAIAGVFRLCQIVKGEPVYPVKLEVLAPSEFGTDIYKDIVRGPVEFSDQRNAMHFKAEDLEEPLAGYIPEIVEASTQIADRYIQSQDDSNVAHKVRELLVQMLPSGSADQEGIASKLHRSASTLQRQLSAEGTSYRDVLENTRRDLAEAYLRDGKYSHSQIAFLVGFSDQSNFARAFKRWTGKSPGQFQKGE